MAVQLTLVSGPARRGKTAYLLRKYRESRRNEGLTLGLANQSVWICPNQLAVSQMRDSLIKDSTEAFLDPRIVTFAGFADSIIAASARHIRPITQFQKRHLLSQAVDHLLQHKKLQHFARVARTPGFLAQVAELIAELKRQDVWPEKFRERCRQAVDHDLAAIYEQYQHDLQENECYDAEGRFWAARRLLEIGDSAAGARFGLVFLDGFSDFTSAQFDILRLLGNRSRQMLVSLTHDSEQPTSANGLDDRKLLFAKTQATCERLLRLFPGSELQTLETTQIESPGLQHLERNLFREPRRLDAVPEQVSGIETLAANGIQGEIEEIARRVKALLLVGKARPQEIVVVFRNLGEVARRVDEVFTDHGIPHHMEPWRSVANTPVYGAMNAILRLHDEDWPFRQLLAVTGNRLFRLFDTTAPQDARASHAASRIALESSLRAMQLPSGRKPLFDQLRRWASIVVDETSQGYAELKTQAQTALIPLEQLAVLLDELPLRASVPEWLDHLERLVHRLGVFGEDEPPRGSQSNGIELSWKMLISATRSLGGVGCGFATDPLELTTTQFLELLESAAHELRLPTPNDAVGRVRILNAETARHLSARHVFLAGLNEQSFAARDIEHRYLGAHQLVAQHSTKKKDGPEYTEQQLRTGDEMLLFYELVTRATESLTLSYPALDEKGQTLSPSPFLTELERCFETAAIPRSEQQLGQSSNSDSGSGLPMSGTTFRQRAVARAMAGDQDWLAAMLSEPTSARFGATLLSGIDCIARRGERGEFGTFDGFLESKSAQAALAGRFDASHLWSPSRLESYAACPFRFFAEQILKLEPPLDQALESDVRRRGNVLHHVLATLHQQLSSEKDQAFVGDQLQLMERFLEVLDKAVASVHSEGLQKWLREIERREIQAWAERYAEQEISYRDKWDQFDQPPRPALFEVRFGPKSRSTSGAKDDKASTSQPFSLNLGEEQILLTGQIDRVDIGRVGGVTLFNIIDYKSGAEVKLHSDKMRSGRQLQLPLYAMAAEGHLLADEGALALSTGYWSIKGKGFETRRSALELRKIEGQSIRTSDEWDQLKPVLLERIRRLIAGIRSGQFPVYNEDQQCTRSCAFSTICRVAQVRSLEKSWEPPSSVASK